MSRENPCRGSKRTYGWEDVSLAEITIPERLRNLDEKAVLELVESIKKMGLQQPITLRWEQESKSNAWYLVLVAGYHRLEAHRRLHAETEKNIPDETSCGWQDYSQITADIKSWNGAEARRWEVAENLHRAELTVLERSRHIAEWIRLHATDEVSSQPETKPRAGRPESGISAATRALGLERNEGHRAVQVASLAPEADAVAKECGLSDNQTALLTAAREPTAKKQSEALRTYSAATTRKPTVSVVDKSPGFIDHEAEWRKAIMSMWNRAPQPWRRSVIEMMQTSIVEEAA